MNREIKFRAWDKENKEMFTPIGYSYMDGYLTCIIRDKRTTQNKVTEYLDENWYEELREPEYGVELMQFTGLKDKNGKEIYEGDIIRENARKNWEVKFDIEYGGFYPFTYCSDGLGYECGRVEPEDCEIIGNIYENPKLLNQ